ncbi:uncharacterized protein LOC134192141 [Corticium candelabrum]|uniref:uncharacterized protein LOC134192141 n=1 Tax=Corticium candelabrum TaxID=121492 RepID=UPI002E25E5CA|nr:uncharacterized protein LOC134192141 [Corticium candelabrum]
MAAVVANFCRDAINCAQRDNRIARLSDTFEECRQKASQLRETPELTAVLDVRDCQRKSGDTSKCFEARKRHSRFVAVPDATSRLEVPANCSSSCANTSLSAITNMKTCTVANTQQSSTSGFPKTTRTATNTEGKLFCDANADAVSRGTENVIRDANAILCRSLRDETQDSVANIRIVRVGSLSASCNPSRQSVNQLAVIQSVKHGDYNARQLPQMFASVQDTHLNCVSTSKAMPFFNSRRDTSLVPSSSSFNKMELVHRAPSVYDMMPALTYVPHWQSHIQTNDRNLTYKSVPSQKFEIPMVFPPQSHFNPNSSSTAYAYTESNGKKDSYESVPQQLSLKIESCRSVFASRYEGQAYGTDLVSPPAKRPRFELRYENASRTTRRLHYSQTLVQHHRHPGSII